MGLAGSILGGVGQVDYCAANAFLDAYARYRHGMLNIFSINWDVWSETGMAVDTELPADLKKGREELLQSGILTEEGLEAFRMIPEGHEPQIIVSTRHFPGLVKRTEASWSPNRVTRTLTRKPVRARPELSSAYDVPGNATEQAVAAIWEELLGVERIGLHDNFFELGGHSLLGTQLIERLRIQFSTDFPLSALMERPTVHLLSKMILGHEDDTSSRGDSAGRVERRRQRQETVKRRRVDGEIAS